MSKKIFKSILISSLAVLVAACVIIFCVLYGFFSSAEEKMLEYQMDLAVQGINTAGESYFDNLKTNEFRITLIDTNGNVIHDSKADAGEMDNHKERKEVAQAMQFGVGRDARYSSTLMEKTVYLAKRMADGKVLRVSVTQYSFVPMLVGMIQPVMTLLAAAIVIAALMAKRMAKQIVKPINTIDLQKPLESDAYDELSLLLTRIDKQSKKIEAQSKKIKTNSEEFEKICDNLTEGIVLIDKDDVILSINAAARKIFNTDASCVGKSFLTIERSEDVIFMLEKAKQSGSGDTKIKKGDRMYSLMASSVFENTAVMIYDITESEMIKLHENEIADSLIAPTQAIITASQLIENGLVNDAGLKDVAKKIHAESEKIADSVKKIINLQKDEQA